MRWNSLVGAKKENVGWCVPTCHSRNVFLIGESHQPFSLETSRILFVSVICICIRAHCVCMRVYVCAITSITSHTSVCGGDENEKKGRGGKKDPDCVRVPRG